MDLEKNFKQITEEQKIAICLSLLESCDTYEQANKSLRETVLDNYKTYNKMLKILEDKNRQIDELTKENKKLKAWITRIENLKQANKIFILCDSCHFHFVPKWGFLDSLLQSKCPTCGHEVTLQ